MAGALPTNEASFTLAELRDATSGTIVQGALDTRVTSVGTDTRALAQGCLFIALEGDRFDGHKFVKQACDAGARVLCVARDVSAPPSVAVLRVADTRAALGAIARAHRRRWAANADARRVRRVIAIVGAAGKTTTRKAISALLSHDAPHSVHATHANFNNQIGVPLTLLGLRDEHQVAVVEVGTNQRGEVATLAAIVEPDVGVLTLIAPEHTEGIGTIDDVAAEEGDLLAALPSDGFAVGNGDDVRVREQMLRAPCTHLHYGFAEGAEVRITGRAPIGFVSSEVVVDGRRFQVPLLGDAGALAVAAAITVSERVMGHAHDTSSLRDAFASTSTERDGRLQTLCKDDGTVIIDDTYNANPGSMRASIEAARELAEANGRRLILVLGEMRELGGLSKSEHEALGAYLSTVVQPRPSVLGVAGDAARMVQSASDHGVCCRFVASSEEAASVVTGWIRAGDLVLVKGSRGVQTEKVVAAIR